MRTTRRNFLSAAATTATSFGILGQVPATFSLEASDSVPVSESKGIDSSFPPFRSVLYKAPIYGSKTPFTESLCQEWKTAGWDGVELTDWSIPLSDARERRRMVEAAGLRIHSVMRGWAEFNSPKPEVVTESIESVKTAIRVAANYGADAVLLVPCRIGGMKMPEPWDFDIQFDPKTLKVSAVVDGDNSPYADYIESQNNATETTLRALEQIIPTAAKEGVRIAWENVWNNLWSTPTFFAAAIDALESPWIGCYFDLGNHTKYARCEEWLKALD
ncbi:MAG: sugar phosphate isomerase/epimerase family protein, partial [Thermoguttaceae bacterium]